MKKLAILALGLLGVFVASCYDDSALKESIASLDQRVKDLESWQDVAANNISSLSTLVEGMGNKVFISSVKESSDGGYEITFTDGKKVTIKDGAPGSTPQIGVKKDSDGVYYWTLNGDWLLGASGEKLRVTGEDGLPGGNGASGVTPQLKIVDGYWYVSTDNGATWTKLDKATGEPGDSMFKDVSWDDGFVYFTLADGTELKVSRGVATVKAIAVVPDYSDGSIEADDGEFELKFDVLPKDAAEGVAAMSTDLLQVHVVYTLTKAAAGEELDLPVKEASASEGRLVLKVDGSALDASFINGELGANASLSICDGATAVTTGYFPLFCNKYNGHEYVDLGLPSGIKWATCNVGATKPEEFGDYFAWGETEPYYEGYAADGTRIWKEGKEAGYHTSSYKWYASKYKLTRYCSEENEYNWDLSSSDHADGKLDFKDYDFVDDAARANWGGKWRTPTKEEWQELIDNCSWTSLGSTRGYLVTSNIEGYKDKSIYLYSVGEYAGTSFQRGFGAYWASSVLPNYSLAAYGLSFYPPNPPSIPAPNREYGRSVRPVIE